MTLFLVLNVILLLLQDGHGSDETKAQLVKLDPPGKFFSINKVVLIFILSLFIS